MSLVPGRFRAHRAQPVPVALDDFDVQVRHASGPVLVEVWLPTCTPCRMFEPVIHQLAASMGERLPVRTLEIQRVRGMGRLMQELDVHATPTLLLFKDGEVVWRAAGLKSIAWLREQLEPFLEPPQAAQRGVA